MTSDEIKLLAERTLMNHVAWALTRNPGCIGGAWESAPKLARAVIDQAKEIEALRLDQAKHLDDLAWERARTSAIGGLLGENGCDCDCEHHPDEHDDECELCLACRIDAVLGVTR